MLTGRIRTLLVVLAGWVLFRAESLSEAGIFFRGLAGAYGWGFSPSFAWQIQTLSLAALLAAFVLAAAETSKDHETGYMLDSGIPGHTRLSPLGLLQPAKRIFAGVIPLTVFLLSLMKIAADSYSPFLYFRF